MNVTPEQANDYLTDVGFSLPAPQYSDKEWVEILGFLTAYGFVKEADYSTEIGGVMLKVIGDVFDKYAEWQASETEDPS
jgi:hypothetical protein